jgi:hypothetical protein
MSQEGRTLSNGDDSRLRSLSRPLTASKKPFERLAKCTEIHYGNATIDRYSLDVACIVPVYSFISVKTGNSALRSARESIRHFKYPRFQRRRALVCIDKNAVDTRRLAFGDDRIIERPIFLERVPVRNFGPKVPGLDMDVEYHVASPLSVEE